MNTKMIVIGSLVVIAILIGAVVVSYNIGKANAEVQTFSCPAPPNDGPWITMENRMINVDGVQKYARCLWVNEDPFLLTETPSALP